MKEPSIAVSPKNPRRLLLAANFELGLTGSPIVPKKKHVKWSTSADSGRTWTSPVYLPNVSNLDKSGDPSVQIDSSGAFVISYLADSLGTHIFLRIARSTDSGANWTTATVATRGVNNIDRPQLIVDNRPFSSYKGTYYIACMDSTGTDRQIVVRRSTNNGSTWGSAVTISKDSAGGLPPNNVYLSLSDSGVIQASFLQNVGSTSFPNIYIKANEVGFSKSTDGGVSWLSTPQLIATNARILLADKGTGLLSNSKPHNTLASPTITFNPKTRTTFVAWNNWGNPGVTSDSSHPDIYLYRQAHGTNTWTKVGITHAASTADQWFPWITCDPSTGYLYCLYYDSRDNGAEARAYISLSLDDGVTWKDYQLSDAAHTSDVVSHDYFGVVADSNKVTPVWMLKNSSSYKLMTDPFRVVCCTGGRGNADGDASESVDIADLTTVVNVVFYSSHPTCSQEADVNASGTIDNSDVTYLTAYLFSGGPAPASCP